MEEIKLIVSIAAVLLSIASFVFARRSDERTRKAETIKNLLGEKETVAYAALKLLRDGLPEEAEERRILLDAMLQACVFEGSDRARALLYRVIEKNREQYRAEIGKSLQAIRETFKSMDVYKFDKTELDLERGQRRISALQRVVEGPKKGEFLADEACTPLNEEIFARDPENHSFTNSKGTQSG